VNRVGTLAREVVARRAAIAAALPALVTLLVALHVTPGLSQAVATDVGAGVDLLALVVGVVYVRAGVTPANPNLEPTDSGGNPMVSLAQVQHAGNAIGDDFMRLADAVSEPPTAYPAPDTEPAPSVPPTTTLAARAINPMENSMSSPSNSPILFRQVNPDGGEPDSTLWTRAAVNSSDDRALYEWQGTGEQAANVDLSEWQVYNGLTIDRSTSTQDALTAAAAARAETSTPAPDGGQAVSDAAADYAADAAQRGAPEPADETANQHALTTAAAAQANGASSAPLPAQLAAPVTPAEDVPPLPDDAGANGVSVIDDRRESGAPKQDALQANTQAHLVELGYLDPAATGA
jgi:hypothetical protein